MVNGGDRSKGIRNVGPCRISSDSNSLILSSDFFSKKRDFPFFLFLEGKVPELHGAESFFSFSKGLRSDSFEKECQLDVWNRFN